MRKQFAGRPAADLSLTDLHGNVIHLSDLKGKTVLLDFWASWCVPCRADGPALDKLYKKYGATDLAIIGISVDEERAIVEKFLSQHPHQFSIALTTENEMPTAYRVSVYPTYMVIDANGNFTATTEGEKGFSDLRKLLKKAGFDAD